MAHGHVAMGKLAYSFRVSMSSQGTQPYLCFVEQRYRLTDPKDVPHLCHNRCCVKLEHLSYEPQSINNQRLVCENESEYFGLHGNGHCFIRASGKV